MREEFWISAKDSQLQGVTEGSRGSFFKRTPSEIMLFTQGKDMLTNVVKKKKKINHVADTY